MNKPWSAVNKPCGARSRHAGAIAGAVAALFAASYAQSPYANPTGAQVVSGTVNVNSPGAGQMNITQQTPKAIVNWNTFSIGSHESVSIAQPSASSTLLNRVIGNDASVIAGRLQANGKVFLVNPAGVIFAPGSSVNVGSMVASTLNISNDDFLAGKFRFVGTAAAPVSNAGSLSAQAGGTIALLGGTVSNTGTVTARLGTVALGAGTDITLDFAGDGLTTLKINQGAANALIGNTGTLAADGGAVVMSAQTADALAGTVLNQQGIVRAQSLAERNGHIVLDGGTDGVTLVSGSLDATGGAGLTGGRIDVTGHNVALLDRARVDASGAAGGGSVRFGGGARGADTDLRNANAIWMSPTAEIHADALVNGNGGHVVAYSDTASRLYGTLSATGGAQSGNGGMIETSGHYLDTDGATINASAPMGKGGTWLLDPFQVGINFGGPNGGGTDTPGGSVTFGPATGPTNLTIGTINGQLNKGTSVTVSTGQDEGGDVGDINVNAPISKTGGGDAVLTLSASGSVVLGYSGISSSAGALGLEFDANVGNHSPNSSVTMSATNITTNGGNLVVTGGPISLFNANISTGAGSVTLNGTATTGNAVAISYSLIATTSGGVSITGTTSGPGAGLAMTQSSVLTDTGSISVSGSATAGAALGSVTGVDVSGGFFGATHPTAPFAAAFGSTGGGSISISGSASGQQAVGINLDDAYVSVSNSATTAGEIFLSGSAQPFLPAPLTGTLSGTGVALTTSSLVSTTGIIAVSGSANGPDGAFTSGVNLDGGFTFTGSDATPGPLAIKSSGGAISLSGLAAGTPNGAGVGVIDSGISTTTGAIVISGTATGGTDSFIDGVSIFNSPVTTTTGDITMSGTASSAFDQGAGLDIHGSNVGSASGNIKLTGQSIGPVLQASVAGVKLENGACDCIDLGPTTVTTAGTVSIYGSGTGPFTQGVLITDGTQITSSNGGAIDIRGAVAGPTGNAPNLQSDSGVLIFNSTIASTGSTGTIGIAGSTNTSDPGVSIGVAPVIAPNQMAAAAADVAAPNVTISTANPGSMVLRAFNDGTASSLFITQSLLTSPGGVLAIMPASVDPTSFAIVAQNSTPITLSGAGGGLSIDPQTFATFSSIPNIVLGSSTHTGLITVNGQCAAGAANCAPTRPVFTSNLTLSNPGAGSQGIVLPFGISMPGQTLTLMSAGAVTDPGGIQATSLLLSGPGSFTLNDPQNNVGTLAMVGAGNVNFLNSGSFAIGPVTSRTYDAANGVISTVDGTNSTLTGNLVAQAATGSVTLNTNLSAGGSVDLVMENGVFTSGGTSTLSAGNAWRVWASTWNGETRGNVQPNTAQPNFYGCLFGAGCSWGGIVPTAGNHFVYVERPTVTVTADGKTRMFGAPNPTFTYTVTGLINGDTAAGTLNGTLTTPATTGSPVGLYPIDPNFTSRVGYVVNEIPATLTVTQPVIFDAFAQSGLQSFFTSQEQTFVYENNLQGTNICVGSNQPLFTTAPPGDTQDILAVEWKRVRSQPNLNSCMLINGQHGCGDF